MGKSKITLTDSLIRLTKNPTIDNYMNALKNIGESVGPLGLLNLLRFLHPITVGLPARWIEALRDVKPASVSLAKEISALSSRDRQKLILIGYSLGGNVVIRTLARLYRENLSIHSAVLLGAAISNKDENIPLAINATQKPIHSMINPNDEALKAFQVATLTPALGTGCTLHGDHSHFLEHCTTNSTDHSVGFYLTHWASYLQNLRNLSSRNQSKKRKK